MYCIYNYMLGAFIYILLAVWAYSTMVDKKCGGIPVYLYLSGIYIFSHIANAIIGTMFI